MARYATATIQRLIDESDHAATTVEKGRKLEELARYLFEKLAAIDFLEANILDRPRAHEIDVAFWNPQNRTALGFIDAILIVECKNHARPVSSAQVGWFVRKLQDRGTQTAVLISLSGITGQSDGESNAHSEILNAMVRDGIRVLVLSRVEITAIQTTAELCSLLKDKFVDLTLRRTVLLDA